MPLLGDIIFTSTNFVQSQQSNARKSSELAERIASGLRINDISQDPSAIGTSTRLRTSAIGYVSAIRSLNSAAGLIGTASSSLSQVDALVQRLREIATQASNGNLSSDARTALNTEYVSIVSEIDRVASTTTYNGYSPLSTAGSGGGGGGGGGSADTPTFSAAPSIDEYSTQTLVAETITITHTGGGTWSVVGSVVGTYTSATQGVAYTTPGVNGKGRGLSFTIASGSYASGASITIAVGVSGSPTLTRTATFSNSSITGSTNAGPELADLDGDGDLDYVSAFSDSVSGPDVVIRFNSAGTFSTQVTYSTATGSGGLPQNAVVGDVDGDGDNDIVVKSNYAANDIRLLVNDGNGNFSVCATVNSGSGGGNVDTQLADIDNDGDLDLIWSSDTNGNLKVSKFNAGNFQSAAVYSLSGASSTAVKEICVGDFTGDGFADVVGVNSTAGLGLILWTSSGSGATFACSTFSSITDGRGVACGDIDNDGDLDVVGSYYNQGMVAYINNGGAFSAAQVYNPGNMLEVALADMDGDGDLDAVAGSGGSNFKILLNNGSGRYSLGALYTAASNSFEDVAIGDVDSNGSMDVFTSGSGQMTRVWQSSLSKSATAGTGDSNYTSGGGGGGGGGGSDIGVLTYAGACGDSVISISLVSVTISDLGLTSSTVETTANATTALTAITSAISTVTTHRATFAGYMGAIESALRAGKASAAATEHGLQALTALDAATDLALRTRLGLQSSVTGFLGDYMKSAAQLALTLLGGGTKT